MTDEASDAGAPDTSAEPASESSATKVLPAPTVEVVVAPEPIPDGAAVLAAAAAPMNDRNLELLAQALSQVGGDRLDVGRELDAVSIALSSLEASGELPAGLGAPKRSDGRSVGRDAAVMTYEGRFGAVVATDRLAKPSLVAEAAADFPPRVFSSVGANGLASEQGIELLPGDPEPDATVAPLASASASILADAGPMPPPDSAAVTDEGLGGAAVLAPTLAPQTDGSKAAMDGVAVVLRAGPGRFAAGISVVGQPTWPPGRFTAVSTVGAHIYASKLGAVAIVGAGDLLAERTLAREVYDRMVVTRNPNEAVRWGLAEISADVDAAILAVDPRRTAFASRPELAWLERTDRDEGPATPLTSVPLVPPPPPPVVPPTAAPPTPTSLPPSTPPPSATPPKSTAPAAPPKATSTTNPPDKKPGVAP